MTAATRQKRSGPREEAAPKNSRSCRETTTSAGIVKQAGIRSPEIQADDAERKAHLARLARKRRLSRFWQTVTGRETVEPRSLATVFSYVGEIPRPLILQWIARAAAKCWNDRMMGMYVSGARRSHLKQQREADASREEAA